MAFTAFLLSHPEAICRHQVCTPFTFSISDLLYEAQGLASEGTGYKCQPLTRRSFNQEVQDVKRHTHAATSPQGDLC